MFWPSYPKVLYLTAHRPQIPTECVLSAVKLFKKLTCRICSAIGYCEVLLHVRIADCWLVVRKFRMARMYVERVHRQNFYWMGRRSKIPVEPEDHTTPIYARLMLVDARISFAQGDIRDARYQLDEAKRLDSSNAQIATFDRFLDYRWALHERKLGLRWKQKELQMEKHKRNFQGKHHPISVSRCVSSFPWAQKHFE